jgi:hypothetical protein
MTGRELRHVAESLPTPVDPEQGRLARAYVTGTDDGRWTVCWGLDGARRKVHVGPAFEQGRDAHRLCRILNERIDQATAVPA